MRNISKERFVATNVRMAFEDGSVSFCIPEGATLADISENLDKVGRWHDKLVSIDVRFKAPDGVIVFDGVRGADHVRSGGLKLA